MEPHSLIILRIRLSNFALTDFSQCGERYTDVRTSQTLIIGNWLEVRVTLRHKYKVQSYFAFLKIRRRTILFFFNFESPIPLKEKMLGIFESDKIYPEYFYKLSQVRSHNNIVMEPQTYLKYMYTVDANCVFVELIVKCNIK